jgi:heterodisulfide reductase subunit B
MLRFAYFPGCSADSTGISFTLSANYVARKVGLGLIEIPDWCCCGTSAALVTDRELALALPARSLAMAEKMDPTLDVVTSCAGCYSSLKAAAHHARSSEQRRRHVEELIGMPYAASAEVFSLLEILTRPDLREQVTQACVKTLGGLKVACYYGCALVRPPDVCKFDDPENPRSMDELLAAVGASPVQWAYKTECCGASHQISEPGAARVLLERIFENAAANGAEALACACPLCLLNLDMREAELNKHREQPFDMPVYYFTELLGLCMGGAPDELGINLHFWPAEKLSAAALAPLPVRDAAPAGQPQAAPGDATPGDAAPAEQPQAAASDAAPIDTAKEVAR